MWSPALFSKPADWGPHVDVTGFVFMDQAPVLGSCEGISSASEDLPYPASMCNGPQSCSTDEPSTGAVCPGPLVPKADGFEPCATPSSRLGAVGGSCSKSAVTDDAGIVAANGPAAAGVSANGGVHSETASVLAEDTPPDLDMDSGSTGRSEPFTDVQADIGAMDGAAKLVAGPSFQLNQQRLDHTCWSDDSPAAAVPATTAAPQIWNVPPALLEFLAAGEPPVYIGFGSMVIQDVSRVKDAVLRGIRMSGVRAIVACGWAGLCKDASHVDRDGTSGTPSNDIFFLNEEVPHDWLFPRCVRLVAATATARNCDSYFFWLVGFYFFVCKARDADSCMFPDICMLQVIRPPPQPQPCIAVSAAAPLQVPCFGAPRRRGHDCIQPALRPASVGGSLLRGPFFLRLGGVPPGPGSRHAANRAADSACAEQPAGGAAAAAIQASSYWR